MLTPLPNTSVLHHREFVSYSRDYFDFLAASEADTDKYVDTN